MKNIGIRFSKFVYLSLLFINLWIYSFDSALAGRILIEPSQEQKKEGKDPKYIVRENKRPKETPNPHQKQNENSPNSKGSAKPNRG